jgi:chromosome partitioning protein
MARIIAVANQKGGVGKTTTSVNLAAALASMQQRVLMVDIDPQGNATMGSGLDKNNLEKSGYDLLTQNTPIKECIFHSEKAGFDVLPGNRDLTAAEVELMEGGQNVLRQALQEISGSYDYIIIDCPPSLSMLTLNGLIAAKSILIPMQCEYYALEGLSALLETIDGIAASVNPELQIEGIIRTMYDPRNRLTQEVTDQLVQHFGDKLFRTVIPRNVRLAEAPSYGLPILVYDSNSTGALAYQALGGELLRRHCG